MNLSLTPRMAAEIASFSYNFQNTSLQGNFIQLPDSLLNDFELNKHSTIQGQTGVLLYRRSSGFAITVRGISPQYQGHHILAFRGTIKEFKPDIITDAFVSASVSHHKKLTHGGFNRTFNSMKGEILHYVQITQPQYIHVVGHSLGGALANLAATMINNQFGIATKLYTFGAPRVGTLDYANDLNNNGYIDHYRIVHPHDPVTALPVWPFVHAGNALQTAGSSSQLFSAEAHAMSPDDGHPGYIISAANFKSFFDMQTTINRNSDRERVVLHYKNLYQVQYNSEWERRIRLCLTTLLYDLGFTTFASLQNSMMSIFTIYDLIAKFLESIAQVVETNAERVKGLIGHMFAFVGQANRAIKQLSYAIIKEAFDLMLNKLAKMAKEAIRRNS